MTDTHLFVTPHWLAQRVTQPDIQILDARAILAGENRNTLESYRAGHLPGACFFDINQLVDHTSPLPHTLPRAESFAVAMQEMGISSNNHLIVYDEGSLFSAPRAWWMLRMFGAQNVSILAGGLAAWRQAGLAEQQNDVSVSKTGEFILAVNNTATKRVTEVLLASHEGTAQIIDARSPDRFNGTLKEPRSGLRCGHIPGALNVYWADLVVNGCLKPEAELRQLFARQGVDLNLPVIASCGSGVTANVILLALTSLGAKDISLYDGSWSEWGARQDLPIEP